MNADFLEAAFHAHKAGQSKFTRRMAIAIALLVDKKPREIVQALEGLGLLRPGSWSWFARNGGITKRHVAQVRHDMRAAR